jgi:hypothetical protein
MDAEWRRKLPEEALALVEEVLDPAGAALEGAGEGLRKDFLRRRERLCRRLGQKPGSKSINPEDQKVFI